MLAVVRSGDLEAALLLHVAGAMLLVGALVVAAGALAMAGGRGADRSGTVLTRVAFVTLLAVAVPAYALMRGGAEWVRSEYGDVGADWIDIGYAAADGGLLGIVVAAVLAGLALRSARGAEGGGAALRTAAAGLTVLVLAGLVVATWAMTTKPG
jgi:hypothetical protein